MQRTTSLPVARLISNEPTAASIRWVMRAVWLSMVLFAVVIAVGHIPQG
jgi:hypothetical protein